MKSNHKKFWSWPPVGLAALLLSAVAVLPVPAGTSDSQSPTMNQTEIANMTNADMRMEVLPVTSVGAGDTNAEFAVLRANAEKGDAQSQFELGVAFYYGKFGVATNYVEAVKWLQQAAGQNHAKAQYNLGVCYHDGLGVATNFMEAVTWFRRAAEQNLADAQFNLGNCYYEGKGVATNLEEAVRCWRQAAGQNHPIAQNNLGNSYCQGEGVVKNEREAVKLYRQAAGQNLAVAQYNLGKCYMNGQGVTKDLAEAGQWYRLSAEQGNTMAQVNLGVFYESGLGVPQDYGKAVKWFRKAAEQNDPRAQCYLAECYYQGQGVVQDFNAAAKWWREAACQNHAISQFNLGVCYRDGLGAVRNYEEAVKWFRLAAGQNLAAAQYNLGVCYNEGKGVTKDYVEAVKWFRLAAGQNLAAAQYNLGVCHNEGIGVTKDYVEAVKWFRLAAGQNFAPAQNDLGVCYADGLGVTKDYLEAYKWWLLAAAQGDEFARKATTRLEHELRQEQRAVGQQRAAEFKPTVFSPNDVKQDDFNGNAPADLLIKAVTNDAKAQNELGEAFKAGKAGVAMDPVRAVKCFRLAADQNYAPAQCNLGVCYERGDGVAKYEVEAYKWDLLAAAQGDARAKSNATLLELMMSSEQVTEGKHRAQVWLEQLRAASPNPVADSVAPTNRLTVAMLAFADKTGEPESAYWRYSLPRMVAAPVKEVKAIRIYPDTASEYGLRQLKLKAGDPIDATQARKIGEIIEARRVVWGDYRHKGKEWTVTAHVMNVASGEESPELSATAADWFEVCDQLAGKILQELALKPTEAERAKMKIPFTTSPVALEYYSQAYALQVERKPFAESERCARQAVAADPRCAEAHCALAGSLFNQGKLEEGSQEIHEALKLKPELDNAHLALGFLMLHQDKPEAAAKEFREAIRLDPDEPENHIRLAEYYATEAEWLQAASSLQAARRLNPVSADVCAHLGLVYGHQGERTKALLELKEAECLDLEEGNALQMTAMAYEDLHEIPLAVEHYEEFLTFARERGANPKQVNEVAERLQQLKASLSPVFVNAAGPKAYSDQSLRETLQARLTAEELALVIFPLASTPEMKVWAEHLTQGATNDFQKAHALYEALARHLDARPGGSRTAQETYADWQTPQASFRCQEYARLFVALARDVGLKAFVVSVDRDYEDKTVLHGCAGILIGDKALLADPSYQWFGVPHKQFEFMDDYQAVVNQLNQSGDLTRLRLAVKLQPDSALSQFNLALELMTRDQWDEARHVLQTALKLDSESWFARFAQGIMAWHENQPDLAVTHLRKAVELYPQTAKVHFNLALVLSGQGRLNEAREEFRAGLKYRPEPDQVAEARHAIARINEEIGSE